MAKMEHRVNKVHEANLEKRVKWLPDHKVHKAKMGTRVKWLPDHKVHKETRVKWVSENEGHKVCKATRVTLETGAHVETMVNWVPGAILEGMGHKATLEKMVK
jgi:hypothetical protein